MDEKTANMLVDVLAQVHNIPCIDVPFACCDSCDMEMHMAINRIQDGKAVSITIDHNSWTFDNIGRRGVDEIDLIELGRHPAHQLNDKRSADTNLRRANLQWAKDTLDKLNMEACQRGRMDLS